jgi:hypothetical protein
MFFISRTYHVTPYKIYSEQQHYRPSHITKNHVIRSTFFFKAPFWGGAPVGGPVGDPHCYRRHGGLSGHPLAPGAGWGGMPGARGSAREFFASWWITHFVKKTMFHVHIYIYTGGWVGWAMDTHWVFPPNIYLSWLVYSPRPRHYITP